MPHKDPEARRVAKREWYLKNRDRALASAVAQRERNIAWYREQKNKPCMDCKLEWPFYVMEFHHRDGSTKLEHVSALILNAGRPRVLDEIAKCDLLCSNCHRIRTHTENG